MKFFGVEITFDEIDKLCGKISNYINKDKNTKCLVLDLFNSNIQDWYNEINDNFSPWIASGMKMERSQTPKELSKCVHNDDRIKTSDAFLLSLQSQFKEQDLKSITEIYGSFTKIRKEKSHWLDDAVKTNIWKVEADEVNGWLNVLSEYAGIINKRITSLQLSVGCNPVSIKKAFNDLIRI